MLLKSAIPTVQEIEKQGKWVCGPSNPFGISYWTLNWWRKHGCPWKHGRKITAKQFEVYYPDTPRRTRQTVWFFDREELAEIAVARIAQGGTGQAAPYARRPNDWTAAQIRQQWANEERFLDAAGREWVIAGAACVQLEVSYWTLRSWWRRGCPRLGGRKLLKRSRVTRFGRRATYLLQSELDEIAQAEDKPCNEVVDSERMTARQVAKLLGKTTTHVHWLRKRGDLEAEQELRFCDGVKKLRWLFRRDKAEEYKAKYDRHPLRTKAITLVRQALSKGPKRFREVSSLGEKAGLSKSLMWLAWKEAFSTVEHPGDGIPATAAAEPETKPTEAAVFRRSRRGKRGQGKETAGRHEKIRQEWESGNYSSQAELARALDVSKALVCMVLSEPDESDESVQKKSIL